MNGERRIRRILVALDASPHSLAALQAAAELAAALDAELAGLFVEDINLLRLGELPFTREYGVFATAGREIDTESIERQLRAQAQQARRALAAQANRSQVKWSFRVSRGSVAAEVLAAAAEADLITLGRLGWSATQQQTLGSTARAILSQAPQLALVLEHGLRLGLAVMCVYDGTPAGREGLLVAASLARVRDGKLTVLLLAPGPEVADELHEQAAEWLADQGLEARYRAIGSTEPRLIARLLQLEGCGLLVLGAESEFLQDDGLFDMLNQIGCPVLVVR